MKRDNYNTKTNISRKQLQNVVHILLPMMHNKLTDSIIVQRMVLEERIPTKGSNCHAKTNHIHHYQRARQYYLSLIPHTTDPSKSLNHVYLLHNLHPVFAKKAVLILQANLNPKSPQLLRLTKRTTSHRMHTFSHTV
jgi:hypothetical protein